MIWLRKLIRYLLIILGMLAVSITVAGTWLATTENGLKVLVRLAQQVPLTQGHWQIQSASGRLIGRIVLHQFLYQSDKHKLIITAETVKLSPNLYGMLFTKTPIKMVQAQKLDIKLPYYRRHLNVAELHLRTEGDQMLRLEKTQFALLDGQISLSGKASLQSGLNWEIQAKAQHLDPSAFDARYPKGNISGNITIQGDLQHLQLALTDLKGQVHQQPIEGKGTITITTPNSKPDALKQYTWSTELHTGKVFFKTHGNGDQQWNATWQLSIPSFKAISPNSAGTLYSKGTITGPRRIPHSIIDLKGTNLRLGNSHIDKLYGHTDVDLAPDGVFQMSLNAHDLQHKKSYLKQITLHGAGRVNGHSISLQMQTDDKALEAQIKGKINQNVWQGKLNALTLGSHTHRPASTSWQLEAPVALVLSKTAASLSPLTWQSNKNRLTTHAKWQKDKGWIASLNIHHVDLRALSELLPEYSKAQDIKGHLTGNIAVEHFVKYNKTKAVGEVILSDAEAYIPDLHLKIHQIQAHVKSQQNKLLYSALAHAGNGNLSVTGQTQLTQKGIPTELEIKGNNFLVSNQPTLYLLASPNLKIQLLPLEKKLNLTGTIHIPKARIQPHDFTKTSTLPSDVVFVDETDKETLKKQKLQRFKTHVNIELILSNDIKAEVKGLKGQLTGHLNLQEEPDHPTMATGHLRIVEGTYSAYGQTLTIDHGALNFINGPINNPTLNIQASRKITTPDTSNLLAQQDAMTVGVNIHGTLKNPQTTLFSNPANQSQADILSLLLFGQRSGDLNKDNAALLLQAASALNFGGNHGGLSNLTSHLRQSLGLNELGVQSETITNDEDTTTQNAAVVLGKYITPKLYVRYSHGILEPTDTLNIRYMINQHFTVQTQSNHDSNGIDLLYTLER